MATKKRTPTTAQRLTRAERRIDALEHRVAEAERQNRDTMEAAAKLAEQLDKLASLALEGNK